LTVQQAIIEYSGPAFVSEIVLAKLIDKICENGHIKTAQLEEILGYGYEVRMN
jgi:hypothetical protein